MDLHLLYQLADDVIFIEAANLPSGDRQHANFLSTDVVVTQGETRKRSKVVSEETASLLKQFTKPCTVATALFYFSQVTNQDARQLADQAFPVIEEMAVQGYLIAVGGTIEKKQPPLQPGDKLGPYKIRKVLQVLDEDAVYKAEDAKGIPCALKLFRPTGPDAAMEYTNEVSALQQLDGVANPVLLQYGQDSGLFFLATTWIEGLPCEEVAAGCRNYLVKKNVLALVDLCLSITHAFHHLHSQGILHGDVHPNNILVSADGRATIIDYGAAVWEGNEQRSARGGVDFYYEPELAASLLTNQRPVALTAPGEQYAVAVLLYKLLTGHHYLPFSYEPDSAYRQIAGSKPISFSAFDLPLPGIFDIIFAKALAKNPAERYPSLESLADALQKGRQAIKESRSFFYIGQNDTAGRLVQFLIERYRSDGMLLQQGLQKAPACSINYGAAGIAYFLCRAASVYSQADLLDVADVWANHAGSYANNREQAFYSASDEITEATVGKRSLYHSPTGVHLVQTIISSARGDSAAVMQATEDYLAACAADCQQLDLTLGKAGLLLGSGLLLRSVSQLQPAGREVVAAFTNQLLQEVWQQLDGLPSLKTEKSVDYLGIAHGWAGLLYATIFWCHESGTPLPETFTPRLEELISMALETGETLQWPVSNSNQTPWLGWCHGNAGYVFLWSLAYDHFRQERFLVLAERAGAALYNNRPQTANLCCGLAGEAYALLQLYNLTKTERYLLQAQRLQEQLLQDIASPDLRNHSLYKGEVGIGLLCCEMAKPWMARMPLFS